MEINSDLKTYIETEILPKYSHNLGHSVGHIQYVINRSLKFARQVKDINYDMVYVIAAYHDLGRLLDDEYHEKISAYFATIDKNLKKFFTDDQIKTIAEAIEDHRASHGSIPRSIYGKIVSTADRTTEVDAAVLRPTESYVARYPDRPLDENIETARQHLARKYGKNGYALNTIYFKDADFELFLQQIRPIMNDSALFRQKYLELKEHLPK